MRATKAELGELLKAEKKHKYHAKAVRVDGITFPSQKEAREYSNLRLLQQAGEIKDIELQPKFELQPSFLRGRKRYRAIYYIADFLVTYPDGTVEVIETKGCKTKDYMIKKKLFLFKYPEYKFTEK